MACSSLLGPQMANAMPLRCELVALGLQKVSYEVKRHVASVAGCPCELALLYFMAVRASRRQCEKVPIALRISSKIDRKPDQSLSTKFAGSLQTAATFRPNASWRALLSRTVP